MRAEQDAVFVVDAAVRHVDSGWGAQFRPLQAGDCVGGGGGGGACELYARDEDGGVGGGGVGAEEVGGYVELVVGGEVDAGFVEEGVVGLVGGAEEEGVRWGGAGEDCEGGVVLLDQELVVRERGRSELC